LHTPPTPSLHGSLTAFRLPNCGLPWHEIRKRLWERGIEIPIIERPDGLLIRVSTHFYNTRAEIDLLVKSLPEVLPGQLR
jgi:isopenicillin-N epimerase